MQLTKTNRAYFNVAKSVSELSDFPRIKIGCCAVYKHKVISTGYNTVRSSPLQKKYNKYRFYEDLPGSNHGSHAELSCLKPLIDRDDIDFNKVQLYIWRKLGNGKLGMAKPCESCMQLIKQLGIKHLYYTTYDGYANEEIIY